jgi:hypothetical protein
MTSAAYPSGRVLENSRNPSVKILQRSWMALVTWVRLVYSSELERSAYPSYHFQMTFSRVFHSRNAKRRLTNFLMEKLQKSFIPYPRSAGYALRGESIAHNVAQLPADRGGLRKIPANRYFLALEYFIPRTANPLFAGRCC